ncbi:hypothetical protein GDO86_009636 [Hymenochirus boettgeri]|uniref:Nucleoside-triphosphatase, cancer-related n=1 Tax=Hymenochirus boettgeri TaxID=247094 RepID=A0A8T2JQ35_9PIPI|nr:hypothetical protein GDO86_009636 [Hymenochirus boettgeri]
MYKHVFLTGTPGIGKTTLIKKTLEALTSLGFSFDGFYTEEIRDGGRRVGFDIVTLSGKRGILARISSSFPSEKHEFRVGQYVVDINSFEQLALPALNHIASENHKTVCVIDEIGKMELFSQSFVYVVQKALDSAGALVFGTIPIAKGKPLHFIEEIRNRRDVKVFNITKENRDVILQDIVAAIQDCNK